MSKVNPNLLRQFQSILGERIKAQRRKAELTQVQLSELVEISRTALANIEVGNQRTSVFLLARLAEALKISPGDLIPDINEAEERLQKTRQVSVHAKRKPKLMIQELEKLNISVGPESNLQSVLKEVQKQPKKRRKTS